MNKQSRNIWINWKVYLNFITIYKRAKLRINIKQGEERMDLQQIEEGTMHFADRKKSSKASRDYKLQRARKKRESFVQ